MEYIQKTWVVEMIDEEKSSDIYDICLEKKSLYCLRTMGEETCEKCKTYKMYKLGFARGRNEEKKIGKITFELWNSEREKLKKQIEDMQIMEYSNLHEQKKKIHKNLIDGFTEQLGILDKEEDVLFSLKEIKSIIKFIMELE